MKLLNFMFLYCWGPNYKKYQSLTRNLMIIRFIRHGVLPLILYIVPLIIIGIGLMRLIILKIKKEKHPKTVTNNSIINAKRKLKRDVIVSIIIIVIVVLMSVCCGWITEMINQKIIDICGEVSDGVDY